MVKIIIFTLGVLIFISQEQRIESFGVDFGDIREILALGREITVDVLETTKWIRKDSVNNSELDFPFIKKIEKKLMNQISVVNHKLEAFQSRSDQQADEIIDMLLRDLPLRIQLDRSREELSKLIGRVLDYYQLFMEYSQSSNKYEITTKREFAESCVSPRYQDLPDLLMSIHRLIVPNFAFEKGILFQFANNSKEASAQICDENQSPQQLLYNLYNTIALTEIKGFMMMQFSYSLLRLYKNGTFDEEMNKTAKDYAVRTSRTLKAVRTAMAFAPRDLWRCDPSTHKEGITYEELKQLFQGYIVNEVDLNPKETCRENCAFYTYSKVYGCYDNLYCSQQRKCNGKVLHCQYIDADMTICPSQNSNRRYDYIEYENGRQFGQKGSCKRATTKVDSWWRWLFWHCSYCMCYCDDHSSSSDRYFSLRNITSDVANNKVITGIKLTKQNQIIHIQIQEGKLLKKGGIDHSSVAWKPVEDFTMSDHNVINGRDYHTLSWEKRGIDMDDLIAPDEYLLTGARFKMIGAHLNFEIRVTPFNFSTGELIKPLEKSEWISNDNTEVTNPFGSNQDRRTELEIKKPDIPTRTKAPNFPDSRSNQFLNFGPTDLEKDAAQTTIPFIDIQPVSTNPPFPLSGAGVYHKGRTGFGGFVALKVMTYNFTNHLVVDPYSEIPLVGPNDIPVV